MKKTMVAIFMATIMITVVFSEFSVNANKNINIEPINKLNTIGNEDKNNEINGGTATLSGKVVTLRYPISIGIENAKVELWVTALPFGNRYTAYTLPNGGFIIKGIDPNPFLSFSLRVTAEGYKTFNYPGGLSILVAENYKFPFQIKLRKESDSVIQTVKPSYSITPIVIPNQISIEQTYLLKSIKPLTVTQTPSIIPITPTVTPQTQQLQPLQELLTRILISN